MGGNTNFPTALDDDASLFDVTDGSSTIQAAHHNNLKEAIKKMQSKIGIFNSGSPTSLDFRLGDPTGGHSHNGASGNGGPLSASALTGGISFVHVVPWYYQGSVPSGASLGAPIALPQTRQVLSVAAQMRRAPSGATAAFDINFGATSLWAASQGLRPIFAPGANIAVVGTPNLGTYPSGTLIVIDADKVGTSEPGQDLSIVFTFRD